MAIPCAAMLLAARLPRCARNDKGGDCNGRGKGQLGADTIRTCKGDCNGRGKGPARVAGLGF